MHADQYQHEKQTDMQVLACTSQTAGHNALVEEHHRFLAMLGNSKQQMLKVSAAAAVAVPCFDFVDGAQDAHSDLNRPNAHHGL